MKVIKRIITIIQDSERDFDERIFLLLTALSELAVAMVLVGDIITGEHPVEIITLLGTVIANPIIVFLCLKWHKVDLGGRLISVLVIFVIMPAVFFFGGGPEGGGILWFTYCSIYVGLLAKGSARKVMLVLLFVSAALDYALAWYRPEWVYPHEKGIFYIDSFISVLAVGVFAYFMVRFQNNLYLSESERAKREREKAERLNASQNAFFANMSHEIRTPINTILGLNEVILKDAVNEEVREDAENIQASGKLLLTLINDILDISKLESGQMKLILSEFKTMDMLSDTASMLSPRAREKKLDFSVDISPELPTALIGDEIRIQQILINLLNNAIKYTKEGRVELSVRAGEKSGDAINMVFSVSDTGKGIKKEDLPYLFSAFKRVDEDENRHIEGTGLGLSIVKQLTDIMGGKINVDSIYTKGSSFVVELPLRIADNGPIGEKAISDGHRYRRGGSSSNSFEAPNARVLIVDDNESNLLVERKLLKGTKISVDCVLSGREALRKTLENSYEAILMDHLMPEMDGIECAKSIRSQKGGLCRNAKIIALTANAGADHKKRFEAAGFDGYLTKPVSGKDLKHELLRLLPKNLITKEEPGQDVLTDTVKWMRSDKRRKSVMITTDSAADMPEELKEKYGIEVICHKIRTREGCFRDGKEIDARGLLEYMQNDPFPIETGPAGVEEHEVFFANGLSRAENIVHISLSGGIGHSGYRAALDAAASFDNVFVVDSSQVSSGQGLLVIEAARMAEKGLSASEIQNKIKELIPKIHMSFIVDKLDFLMRSGEFRPLLGRFLNSLMSHPVLELKKGKLKITNIYMGAREYAFEAYVSHVIKKARSANKEMLIITYAGMREEELFAIRDMVKPSFDNVYLVQASPAISANCGPNTLGLLYRER